MFFSIGIGLLLRFCNKKRNANGLFHASFVIFICMIWYDYNMGLCTIPPKKYPSLSSSMNPPRIQISSSIFPHSGFLTRSKQWKWWDGQRFFTKKNKCKTKEVFFKSWACVKIPILKFLIRTGMFSAYCLFCVEIFS